MDEINVKKEALISAINILTRFKNDSNAITANYFNSISKDISLVDEKLQLDLAVYNQFVKSLNNEVTNFANANNEILRNLLVRLEEYLDQKY